MGGTKQEEAKEEANPEEEKEEKKEDKQEEKKQEKPEEKKEEAKPSLPPPIVLSVDLHCVGCAKKIERSILKCRGVEGVEVDMVQNQVTVKGMVDPKALCSRVQKKTFRKAKVLSPPPQAEGESTPEAVPSLQVSEITTVELHVNMHCEACAQQLRRKILKMRGVQTAESEMRSGRVTVTGTMKGEKLVEYIYRRTGKLARIIPQPPKEEEKKEEAEKKAEDKPPEKEDAEKKEEEKAPQQDKAEGNSTGGGNEEKGADDEQKKEGEGETNADIPNDADTVKRMVYWNGSIISEEEMAKRMMMHWMPVYVIERPPPPPPQIFSDENPNACCIS